MAQQFCKTILKYIVSIFSMAFKGDHLRVVTAAGLACSAIELGLLAMKPSSFWGNEGLPWPILCSLAQLVMLFWLTVCWLVNLYLVILLHILHGKLSGMGRRLFVYVATIPAIIFMNYYIVSWVFFLRTNMFANTDTLFFAIENANMLFRYFWTAEPAFVVKFSIAAVFVNLGLMLSANCLIHFFFNLKAKNTAFRIADGKKQTSLIILPAFVFFVFFGESTWLVLNSGGVSDGLLENDYVTHIDSAQGQWNPWPSYSFEIQNHVNPAISMLSDLWSLRQTNSKNIIIPQHLLRHRRVAVPRGRQKLTTRKSVILITIESLRSDAILRTHQGREVIPYINKLARTGVFFPNCYSQSTQSDHSDPSILASLYPLRSDHVRYYNKREPWPKMLPYDLLKPYDYSTAIVSSQDETWGNMHHFYESDSLDYFYDARTYRKDTATGLKSDNLNESMLRYSVNGKVPDNITADAAINWLTSQLQNDQPFFLHVNFQSSHFPYQRPDGLLGPFIPCVPPAEISMIACNHDAVLPLKNAYYNALEYIDNQVGRIVNALNQAGVRDQTIVVITGDHGEAFCESTEMGHAQSPLETTTKVGLIINCPGTVAANYDTYLVQSIDIVPTTLKIVGLPVHPSCQGLDVLDDNRPKLEERLCFIHCRNPLFHKEAIISGTGWKYTIDRLRETSVLHFRPTDLVQHPNLVSDEPKITAILHDVLQRWRDNQLEYYKNPAYYNWYYAPQAPTLIHSELEFLRRRAVRKQ